MRPAIVPTYTATIELKQKVEIKNIKDEHDDDLFELFKCLVCSNIWFAIE